MLLIFFIYTGALSPQKVKRNDATEEFNLD